MAFLKPDTTIVLSIPADIMKQGWTTKSVIEYLESFLMKNYSMKTFAHTVLEQEIADSADLHFGTGELVFKFGYEKLVAVVPECKSRSQIRTHLTNTLARHLSELKVLTPIKDERRGSREQILQARAVAAAARIRVDFVDK